MKQELSEAEISAIRELWEKDISVGGAPEGWDLEYFQKKIENEVYNGCSFKYACMRVLSKVPRPGDVNVVVEERKDKMRALLEQLNALKKEKFSSKK